MGARGNHPGTVGDAGHVAYGAARCLGVFLVSDQSEVDGDQRQEQAGQQENVCGEQSRDDLVVRILLEQPEHLERLSVVDGRCRWTIIDPRHALLELSVHATAPVRFDVDIILPARRVVSALTLLARGGTIAITTQRHSGTLTPRSDIRSALNKLVLFKCPPSAELDALATSVSRAVC